MPSLTACYSSLVAALAEHYGEPSRRVPRSSALETVLAAALARSLDPRRTAAAIEALSRAHLLEPGALGGASPQEIRDALRDAGVALPLAGASLLRRLASWCSTTFPDDDPATLTLDRSTDEIRLELAAINGVGPATADAILLALGRPTYPVDRGTYRILVRHGWIDASADYDEVSELARSPGRAATRRDRPAGRLAGASGPPVLRPEDAEV